MILLSFMAISSYGQVQTVGIQKGLNISNVTSLASNNRYGDIYGLTYDLIFQDKYTLGIDLLYNQRGFDDKLTFTDISGNQPPTVISKYYSDYFSVPLKIGYVVGNKLKAFAKLGITPSVLIKAHSTIPIIDTDGDITGEITTDTKSSLLKYDLGGLIDIGLSYAIFENINMFSSLMYNQSFATFYKQPVNDLIRHYSISLSLGLKYQLN